MDRSAAAALPALRRARLCSATSSPISESLKAGTNTGTFFSYADFRMPRSFTFSLRIAPDLTIDLVRANDFAVVPSFEDFRDDGLDVIEVRLRLQRVVHAVVAGLIELDIIHLRVVLEVRTPGSLDQTMRHQRAG